MDLKFVGNTWPWAEISVSGAGMLLRIVIVRLEGVRDLSDKAVAQRIVLDREDE